MSWEYYVIPTLFWVAAAIIGVGVVVATAMVIRAVWDLIQFDCGLGKYKEKDND